MKPKTRLTISGSIGLGLLALAALTLARPTPRLGLDAGETPEALFGGPAQPLIGSLNLSVWSELTGTLPANSVAAYWFGSVLLAITDDGAGAVTIQSSANLGESWTTRQSIANAMVSPGGYANHVEVGSYSYVLVNDYTDTSPLTVYRSVDGLSWSSVASLDASQHCVTNGRGSADTTGVIVAAYNCSAEGGYANDHSHIWRVTSSAVELGVYDGYAEGGKQGDIRQVGYDGSQYWGIGAADTDGYRRWTSPTGATWTQASTTAGSYFWRDPTSGVLYIPGRGERYSAGWSTVVDGLSDIARLGDWVLGYQAAASDLVKASTNNGVTWTTVYTSAEAGGIYVLVAGAELGTVSTSTPTNTPTITPTATNTITPNATQTEVAATATSLAATRAAPNNDCGSGPDIPTAIPATVARTPGTPVAGATPTPPATPWAARLTPVVTDRDEAWITEVYRNPIATPCVDYNGRGGCGNDDAFVEVGTLWGTSLACYQLGIYDAAGQLYCSYTYPRTNWTYPVKASWAYLMTYVVNNSPCVTDETYWPAAGAVALYDPAGNLIDAVNTVTQTVGTSFAACNFTVPYGPWCTGVTPSPGQ